MIELIYPCRPPPKHKPVELQDHEYEPYEFMAARAMDRYWRESPLWYISFVECMRLERVEGRLVLYEF